MHFCAANGLQLALHLVRHGLRVSRWAENERARGVGARGSAEPLLQAEVYPLAERLLAAGHVVLIETSGERFIGGLPEAVIKIVDVKCPDSGEMDPFDMRNLGELSGEDEVKFVISSRGDYEFAREFTREHGLVGRVKEVLFSPVHRDPNGKWTGLEPRQLVEWMLEDGLQMRLGLQLHKIVWDPALRGV